VGRGYLNSSYVYFLKKIYLEFPLQVNRLLQLTEQSLQHVKLAGGQRVQQLADFPQQILKKKNNNKLDIYCNLKNIIGNVLCALSDGMFRNRY
jgi:hypothetical protein